MLSEPSRRVRIASALCYLPFASVVVGLITLLKFSNQSFAVYHVRQGFALFLVWFLSLIVLSLAVWIGLLFWLVLLFFSFRVAFAAWLGREASFPGVRLIAKAIPVEAIYSHLTGNHFPR